MGGWRAKLNERRAARQSAFASNQASCLVCGADVDADASKCGRCGAPRAVRANATPPTEAQMAALADLRARAERRAAEDVMGSFASRERGEQAGRRGGV